MNYSKTLEQNDSDYDKYDESMMPDNLPQEIEQQESQKKPNLEEPKVINLRNEEDIKNTRINIRLEEN